MHAPEANPLVKPLLNDVLLPLRCLDDRHPMRLDRPMHLERIVFDTLVLSGKVVASSSRDLLVKGLQAPASVASNTTALQRMRAAVGRQIAATRNSPALMRFSALRWRRARPCALPGLPAQSAPPLPAALPMRCPARNPLCRGSGSRRCHTGSTRPPAA